MSKIKSVLVTGANGLLGRSLCKLLVSKGLIVVGVVHKEPSEIIHGVTYKLLDLETDWNISLLPENIDAVVHLAQSPYFRDFPNNALKVFQVNVASTAKLLEYSYLNKVTSFVFASSGGIYGNGNQAFKENSVISSPGSLGYYLGSKLSGEVMTHSYSDFFHVNVLRYFFIYGSDQRKEMLIPRLMENVLQNKSISLQGEEGIKINPIHVEDAALATYFAILKDNSAIYNISGPEILSLRSIANLMGNFYGISPVFSTLDGSPKDLIGDNAAMQQDLIVPSRKLADHLGEIHNAIIK
jgi:UDP-glucose 4-epimerase